MENLSNNERYAIKFNIEDSKLLIKVNNSEEKYINSFSFEDITKKYPIFIYFKNEEIKEEFENAEKKVELLPNNILKLDLKLELKIIRITKIINICFNLNKDEMEVLSIEQPELRNDEKDPNNLANELYNNENFEDELSVQKKTDNTITYSNLNDLNNIILTYTSYKCPFCKKIPKIIIINDNKIMINCCEKYNYSVIDIKDFLDILDNNYEKSEKNILKYCENCQNVQCEECKKKNKVIVLEEEINKLMLSESKHDKKSSMNESEKLKERKENINDFTDKTNYKNYYKGEPLIGDKNKYSPNLPKCNELIN